MNFKEIKWEINQKGVLSAVKYHKRGLCTPIYTTIG